ncbi:MAG: hypothetical protein IPH18_07810 [Chitinophagaceae bacterium]|nr:hypothetical protein [Chitinophagaceae bacterium]
MNTTGNNIVKSELQVDIKTGLVLAKATVTEMNTIVEVMGMEIPTTGRSFSTTTVKAL